MASSKSNGPPGKPGRKPSPFADRRVILLIAVLVGIAGYYGYRWWVDGAARSAAREQLIADTRKELSKDQPDRDVLSKLMARMTRLTDASTSSELLSAQAGIELVRGRAEKADALFGAIAASPTASPEDRSLGARILLAKHAGFGGDVVQARTMLQRAMVMAETAYSSTQDVKDLFRAWQAASRLWDDRAAELAKQLKANHAATPESRLVELNENFLADKAKVADLVIDFVTPPAELRAMQTLVKLILDKDLPAALESAEQQLNIHPGVPAVRFVLAMVLHGCVIGHAKDSPDRASFVNRRNAQLDWLDQRIPVGQPKKWAAMRETN